MKEYIFQVVIIDTLWTSSKGSFGVLYKKDIHFKKNKKDIKTLQNNNQRF